MKRLLSVFLLFAILSLHTQPAFGQSDGPQISLLDRSGKTVTSIIDGNQVRLRIRLDADVNAQTRIAFTTPNVDGPLAECVIQTGSDSCDTPPFHALGWYWDPDGSAQTQRMIQASVNGSQASGSLTVNVIPRPVVMVHGFNSDYTAGTNYLGPNG
ncbi:MAG: hypothetical protein FIB03_16480 [Anaerolineae bacterium]|nr:hypothetical protein [Anaerolineae bacterium]